jgi:hypothetical protein
LPTLLFSFLIATTIDASTPFHQPTENMSTEDRVSSYYAIEKLKDGNYTLWAMRMRDILMEKGVWEIVDGTETLITAPSENPSRESLADARASRARRQKAVSTMRLALDDGLAVRYTDLKYTDPKVLWEQLQADHKKAVVYDEEYLETELFSIQLSELGTVRNYVNHIDDLLAKLQLCGRTIEKSKKMFHYLHGLPKESGWTTLKQVLKGTTTADTEVADIVRRLEAHEAEVRREKGIEPGMALFTGSKFGNSGNRNGKKWGNSAKNGSGNGADARKTTDVQTNSGKTCFGCGKKGHIRKECRSRKKTGKEGQGNESTSTPGDKAAVAQMWMMRAFTMSNTATTGRTAASELQWYLDSACTNHMTPERTAFVTYRKLAPNERQVETATEDIVPAVGIGSVRITCALSDGSFAETTVRDVLHVPLAGPSLLSVGQLSDPSTELEVHFGQGGARIYRNNGKGSICGFGRKVGRMYVIVQHATDIPKDYVMVTSVKSTPTTSTAVKMTSTAVKTTLASNAMVRPASSLQLWHCRLGHLNHRKVSEMHKFATGIPSMSHPATLDRCTGCLEGKMIRHPFKPAERKTSRPLSLIHFDLCGPMQVESIGRSRYFLLGTDDFSRWRVVKFLHKKSDAPKMFEDIRAEFERHFSEKNYKIGAIRTDNGGEFTSAEFLSALRSDGIQAQTTIPHTPQEDGVTAHKGFRLGCWVMVVARTARALIYFLLVHFFGSLISLVRLSLWSVYSLGYLRGLVLPVVVRFDVARGTRGNRCTG